MGFIEALVLLSLGVFSGILSTVFDVLLLGTPSFLSHFMLWVLLNALVAVHVESRLRAVLWAIPFNLGYIEAYFITTVASFESYSKRLMVPLALVALIAPLISYALWAAKSQRNTYGKVLSVLIVAGALVSSYLINGRLTIYDGVMAVLLAYVLLWMPVRRLKISRGVRPPDPYAEEAPVFADDKRTGTARKPREERRRFSFGRAKEESETAREAQQAPESTSRRTPKARRFSFGSRRAERARGQEEREQRLRRTSERRDRRRDDDQQSAAPSPSMPTLGNVRQARRSTRS